MDLCLLNDLATMFVDVTTHLDDSAAGKSSAKCKFHVSYPHFQACHFNIVCTVKPVWNDPL